MQFRHFSNADGDFGGADCFDALQPAVIIDTQFRLVRGAGNYDAAHPDYVDVNRPEVHSARAQGWQ
jgi:hypothetical protein